MQSGVVLLHGIACNSAMMLRMQKSLQKRGFKTLNLSYKSRKRTLEQLANDVRGPIQEFADELNGEIHFVAHSMGGLLTRVLLMKYRPERLGRVVMLGTPNKGSEVADFLREVNLYRKIYGPAGQQLCTHDNEILSILPPVDYEVGVIAGSRAINPVTSNFILPQPNDGKVSVESTKLEGMTDHIVIPTSHAWLTQSSKAIAQTTAFLLNGKFTASPTRVVNGHSLIGRA